MAKPEKKSKLLAAEDRLRSGIRVRKGQVPEAFSSTSAWQTAKQAKQTHKNMVSARIYVYVPCNDTYIIDHR